MSPSDSRPVLNRPLTRAEITDRAAREIIEAETTARRQQIARLRSARLRKEAAAQPSRHEAPVSPRRKKAG